MLTKLDPMAIWYIHVIYIYMLVVLGYIKLNIVSYGQFHYMNIVPASKYVLQIVF